MRNFPYIKFAFVVVVAIVMLGATLEFAAGRSGAYAIPGRELWITPNISFTLYPFLQLRERAVVVFTSERIFGLRPVNNRLFRKCTRVLWFKFAEYDN